MSLTDWQWHFFFYLFKKGVNSAEEYFMLIELYNSIKETSKVVHAHILHISLSQSIYSRTF